jgi:hypothetical protein
VEMDTRIHIIKRNIPILLKQIDLNYFLSLYFYFNYQIIYLWMLPSSWV